MLKRRKVLRTVSGLVTVVLIAFLVTTARSQDRLLRTQVERATANAVEVIDIGPYLWQLEASYDNLRSAEPEMEVLAAPAAEKRVSVLVHFEPPNAARGKAVVAARRQEVKTWAGNVGGRVHHEYKTVLPNVINLRDIPEARLKVLRAMPGVVKVENDRVMHAHLTVSTPLIRALQSQITGAGHSADGSGVRVCILDTGIDSDHIMYSSRIDTAAGWDFANNDSNPEDDNGHGSNVAGISTGGTGISLTRCSVSTTFQGVAPQATLIGIKVLDQNGSGSFSDIIAGINYGADQTASGGRCDVINMSLGGGAFSGNCDSDSAAVAANNAVDAGVVVVASAGNECNSNQMGTPACGSKVIAVGAVYDDDFPNCESPTQNSFQWCCDSFCFTTCTDNGPAQDSLVCFSNNSTTIDVAAPGCIATSADNAAGGASVSGMCGTSQASPHVAGLAALILSKDGTLTPTEVRQIIRDGAIDMGPTGFDSGYGWGRVDAINSLDLVSGGGCTGDPDCDDGLFCNGAETCDIPSGNCQAGTAPNCDDGVGCTNDSCNEGTNSCDNIASDANCEDGLFCNGSETCDPVLDCQAGTTVNCDDGVGCTTDSCNEGTNQCDNIPSNGLCDDGQFCNGSETCDPGLDCQAGTAPNCDDGVGCTDDSCNEGTDQCDNITNDANCDDGLFCNGAETCNATLDCQSGSDPCPGQICDEGTGTCNDCIVDGDCDDGVFCNGAEACVGGACQAGTTINCDDGVGCTDDSCNEGTNSCDNVVNNANCDDGLFCNGAETCDAGFDCQAGTTVNCDDGVVCTDDSCNEGTSSCDNTANDANCPDDGLFCNGTEFCDAVNDCSSTGDPCGGAGCNEGTGTCAGPVAQLEGGSLSVGASAVTVNLTNTYLSPVIVATVQYSNNTIPVLTRITGVTSTSFDVYLQNPGDLSTPVAENVSYLVVEEGTWTIDGVSIEAQTYLSTVTDENNSWVGQVQSYGQSYTSPVVVGQVMSVNDLDWSVFWCRGNAQTNPPSSVDLATGKHVAEDPVVARSDETIGFIVFESGHGTIGGVEFEALLGADTVLGVDDAPPYTYTFSSAFGSAPTVGVTNIGGMDGGNGGWGQIHGPTIATTTTLNMSIDEDQINDAERNRTTDQLEYVVFAGPVVYPAAPGCLIDPDCDDGLYCNGSETCNAGTCQSGTAPNCDDGVGCTDDACNEGTDSCDNTVNNANCDNGLFCDGSETCDGVLDCQAGTTVNCDDGVGCTDDSCNEATDSCDNIANNANCPDDGLFCNGTEFCDASADCSSTGDPCLGGEVCNEGTNACDPGSAAKMETGTVSVGSGGATVNLTNSYASPVVVCTVNYSNNTIPVVTRVSAVTSTSFDVRLQNAGSGTVAAETVHYIVVEEGTWTIDGVNIEAQVYNSTVTDENNSWVGEARTYGQGYTTPVVLGQVMSENDADWSVFWDQGTSRTTPPSASSLRTGKTVCEDSVTTRGNETVGFIVIEAGSGTINGVAYEAALGADTVRGVTNTPPYTYSFGAAFGSTPQVAIVTMAAVDGNNGGWAYLYGASPLSAGAIDLVIDEDTIGDTERKHTPEQVFYLVFESAVTVP